ncbi:MAG: TetR/AcrR family transcriptional regulator [Firmicutes bacterium]|nr:TetR/AcrR family transcriptional regulator [Bacillota bacterium]
MCNGEENSSERLPDRQESPVKEAISSAALELFAQNGFGQTSVRDIVNKAGTTLPMVYYYFDSKQGLYSYILRQAAARLLDSTDPDQTRKSLTAIERLETGIASFIHFCQANEAEVQLIFQAWFAGDLPPDGPSIIGIYEKMVRQIAAILQSGIESGEFRELDIWEASQALIGIMTNYVARILVGNEAFRPVEQSQRIVELLAKGLENT